MKFLEKIKGAVLLNFDKLWNKKRGINAKVTQQVFVLAVIFTLGFSLAAWASIEEDFVKAAASGDVLTVNALLEKGVNIDATANDGTTALFSAVSNGHKEIA